MDLFDKEERYMYDELKNESALLNKPLSTNCQVPGNINKPRFYEFWQKVLKANDTVLKILKDGYKIPFIDGVPPPPSMTKNNKSFLENKEFGITEIKRLEALGCIYRVKDRPWVVLPLSVVYSKKWRLVVDCSRTLNPFVQKIHVKLETLDEAESVLKKGDWQAISDLDSGYWHIGVSEESQKFLGIHYIDEQGDVHYFQWKVLFLGLTDAVRIFTKMLKPHRAHLNRQGIRHNFFIDDQCVLGNSQQECFKNNSFALSVLRSAGWVVKEEKCSGPDQSTKFLGQIRDLNKMMYFCPESKKDKIFSEIENILSKKKVHVRSLASLYGKIVSNRYSLGDIVRLMSRFGFRDISAAPSWSAYIPVSSQVRFELEFFKNNWVSLNGCLIRPEKHRVVVDCSTLQVASDASAVGGYIYEVKSGSFAFKRAFELEEVAESSTSREFKVFEDFYDHFGEKLQGEAIVHYTGRDFSYITSI